MKKRREAISKRKTNRCKGPGLSHSCPDMRKKKIMAMGRQERTGRESRKRGSKYFIIDLNGYFDTRYIFLFSYSKLSIILNLK